MAKKHKHRAPAPLSATELRERSKRASQEGRYQQALDLAKQLCKVENTPANQELLLNTYLGRAQQLRSQGQLRDAATTLQAALQQGGGNPAWLGRVAEELAASGAVGQALELLQKLPDSPAYAQVLVRAADTAVQQEAAGRAQLPPHLHEDFDRVFRAFAQVEAGQDDQARETLQPIGLRSPFLEWKVLLRGLSAYYQEDDARALENWQRLSAERLPARLIAPYRMQIDAAYRSAQSLETQQALRKHADRLSESGVLLPLRQIQAALAGRQSLPEAFRMAEGIVPALRQQAPHLVPRLASCFYWAIVHDGERTDLPRYQRVFGARADDPNLERLEALASEQRQELDSAHMFWHKYEKTVAANPGLFPEGQASRVRSLIWRHMGTNAASIPDEEALKDLPPFLRDHPDRPRPLKPAAEECYRSSIQLAPDQLGAYEDLFEYYRSRRDQQKAAKTAKELLERFPNHVPSLDKYGDLCMEKHDYGKAVEMYQRALQANPLDRRLRQKVGNAHLFHARTFAEAGAFPEARTAYQAALAFEERGQDANVLCKWAACEFKAGENDRAEELLQQALAQEGNHLAIAYSMVIEAIRLKLKAPLKKRFDKDFNAALAEPPTAAGAAAVAETTAAHVLADIIYYGQKTHQKKVLAYLEKARAANYDEMQLERVCSALRDLKIPRQLTAFAELGQQRFPKSPFFYLVEAQALMEQGPHACPYWKVNPLLETAHQLAQALPPDERRRSLLDEIQKRLEATRIGNPLMQALEGLMDPFFGFGGDEYDDDDDDWDGEEEGFFEFPFGNPFGGGGGGRGKRRR